MIGMEDYFDSSDFYDCIVKSKEGYEFKLHRVVLAKISDVFKAMFTTKMNEGITKEIKLEEKTEVLRELFQLIYTGKTMIYEQECLNNLICSLQPSNSIEVLIFAHINNFTNLLHKVVDYIVR